MKPTKAIVLLLVALCLGAGCSGSLESGSGNDREDGDSGHSPGEGGEGGNNDPSNGGSNKGGSGGRSPGGSGGGGGSSAMGGAAGEVSGACNVQISTLSETSLTRVVAGPGRLVTLVAQVLGGAMAQPNWHWFVQFQNQIIAAAEDAAGELTFEVAQRGLYTVTATTASHNCSTTTVVRALDANERTTDLWVRVLPPNTQILAPNEQHFTLTTDGASQLDVRLRKGDAVAIAPKRMSNAGVMVEVPSFVRLIPRQSTFRWEGHTRNSQTSSNGRFVAQLDRTLVYDLLLVPDLDFAPILLQQQTTEQVSTRTLEIDKGIEVSGVASTNQGPVVGARVLLRAGELPSTLATTNNTGAFALWTRQGRYGAVIRAPEGTTLPDLNLPQSEGLQMPAAGSVQGVQIKWNDLTTTNLTLEVLPPSGTAPMAQAVVELSSVNNLAAAGSLRVGTGAATELSGQVFRRATTNQAGVVDFASLPRGSYAVRVLPPALPGLAPNALSLELDKPSQTQTVRVTTPVNITGKLVPVDAAAGATIAAYDALAPTLAPITALVGSDGGFRLPVPPNHSYRLRLIPSARAPNPVVPLATVQVAALDLAMPERSLPRGRRITGVVTDHNGAPVPSSVVQIFCLDEGSDCRERSADGNTLSVVSAVPLAEVLTDAAGKFSLTAIDPASP